MNYEEKYKEALERAKRLHGEPTGGTERIVCEQIFPELNESYGEKIRKGLINYFNHHKNGINIFYGIKGDDILAWLEKARETYESEDTPHIVKAWLLANIIWPADESDDERTRKELIEQVAYIIPNNDEVDSEGDAFPTYQKRIDKYRAWLEKQGKKLDPDKVIAWLVANICDFEYYVKRFKQDFGL